MKRQVTIKDIAKELNIHHSTVSRALRDHPDISDETKAMVQKIAKEMDYHPDSHARSFRNRRSNIIGVIVPEIKIEFFSTVISGIEEIAYNSGYTIMVSQSNENHDREIINVRALASNLAAGVLLALAKTTITVEHLDILARRDIPFVLFDRTCEDMSNTISKVVLDDFAGAFMAVEYLIKNGKKKIAHFAGSQNISVGRNRLQGYLAALKKYNLPVQENLIITGGFRQDDGIVAYRQLRRAGIMPDAIFAANDAVAIGAYLEIRKDGFRIPDDIALVGFGNFPQSNLLDPPLTTVEQSPYLMGQLSTKMLINKIEHTQSSSSHEIIKPELIIKGSA